MMNLVLAAAGLGLSLANTEPINSSSIVSEPASLALLAVGLFALSRLTRRRPVPAPERSLGETRLPGGQRVYIQN